MEQGRRYDLGATWNLLNTLEATKIKNYVREIIDITKQVAEIPSFSSYEERIHPFIYDFIKENRKVL